MPRLPDSGELNMNEIAGEFGGTTPHSLSEYYRNGAYTTSNNTSVPTSGAISIGQFYDCIGEIHYTISGNTTNFKTMKNAPWVPFFTWNRHIRSS